ncbi:MAG: hypothetical protein HQK91_00880 [Nitrospirae bacterium]|nr:hypothetical protein [Nitrospirota bacterium]
MLQIQSVFRVIILSIICLTGLSIFSTNIVSAEVGCAYSNTKWSGTLSGIQCDGTRASGEWTAVIDNNCDFILGQNVKGKVNGKKVSITIPASGTCGKCCEGSVYEATITDGSILDGKFSGSQSGTWHGFESKSFTYWEGVFHSNGNGANVPAEELPLLATIDKEGNLKVWMNGNSILTGKKIGSTVSAKFVDVDGLGSFEMNGTITGKTMSGVCSGKRNGNTSGNWELIQVQK